jgi:Tfp pilus assembly protein PilV
LSPVVTRPRREGGGFTLIEVIGALLIFSIGVIMLLQLTSSLSERLEYAALNSVITAEGQERMDSLSALSYSSFTVGVEVDTMTFRGVRYRRTQEVTQFRPLVREVELTIEPLGTAEGPSYTTSTLVSEAW